MSKLNNKGFTLVELLATVILLSIIVGIAGYSITSVIEKTKEKDYRLLVKEIKNSVELYYQECRYVNNNCDSSITLGFLVDNGYLKGNSTTNDVETLMNPNDGNNISDCEITYQYANGKIKVEAVTTGGSCPTSEDYSNN